MDYKIIIETIGTIEKKEMLESVGYDELVLEVSHPFAGYHGTSAPDNIIPRYLYAITRSKYTDEKVIRIIQKIKKDKKLEFDGTPSMVTLFNMLNPAIRIKGVQQYGAVPVILQAFKEEGVDFMSNRKIEPYTGIIKERKYFLLEEMNDHTFKDYEMPYFYYFVIPVQLRFTQFEKMTLELKRNIDDSNFDAALGTIYRKEGLIDIIRVYDEKCSPQKLEMIRQKYLTSISKITE